MRLVPDPVDFFWAERGPVPVGLAFANGNLQGDEGPLVDGPASARTLRWKQWRWWILGFALGGALYLSTQRAGVNGGDAFLRAFLGFAGGVIVLLVVLMLLLTVRPKSGGVALALKMARSGQVDWAITELQRQIDRRGDSAERSGALGDCYLLREDWRQAYIHYQDAERSDGRRGRYLAKQGFALWKLGRGNEAAELLEKASLNEPLNPSHAWTACLILADQGRYDDAREHLLRAEILLEKLVPRDSPRRRALEDSIEVCRKRLAQQSGPEAPRDPS